MEITLTAGGSILVGDTDVAHAEPREILALRRQTLGYVSQFLRVVPRVPTREVVAEPLLTVGRDRRCGGGAGRRPSGAAQHPRAPLGSVPHHLFRRRTAAGEHRPRLCL